MLDLLNFVPDPRAVSISEDRRGLGVIYLRTADSGQRNGYVNGVKRCTVYSAVSQRGLYYERMEFYISIPCFDAMRTRGAAFTDFGYSTGYSTGRSRLRQLECLFLEFQRANYLIPARREMGLQIYGIWYIGTSRLYT